MRRDFLKACAATGLGLAVPVLRPAAAHAAETTDGFYGGPYYVVFNASGGWDTGRRKYDGKQSPQSTS